MIAPNRLSGERQRLIILNWFLIAACCVSLVFVAQFYSQYYISFRPAHLFGAVALLTSFALVSLFFAFASDSFGYIVSFYSYLMIAGYLWLNHFSELVYDHRLAALSATTSAIAFALPALFICSPVRRVYTLSSSALNLLLTLILLIGLATVLIGATYSFRVISIEDIYKYRSDLNFPTILNYVIGVTSNALLPFAFACFVARRDIWRAGAVLFLLMLFYPITLSKLALFTPSWLAAIFVLSRFLNFKLSVTLTLLLPISAGIFLVMLSQWNLLPYELTIPFFGLVNFRMIAVPSLAMEYYNSFFATHPVTHFCQIRLLKSLVSCPYQEQLADVIYNAFGIGGQFNASLFATEGIASVGVLFAPITAFAAGLVIALGNRLSAGLPPQFILISSAVLAQALLNVPLSTVLLTHGASFLFLLWYITPRELGLEASKPLSMASP
ncbi:hypothetical protein [Bradyrhizobium sp. Ash2021]|uniref:hypothetical protein n=1 Tax=Bradyrhizobium sp. Ash2021 TaxID=2954771 RepID=UPI002814FCA1|nr:hypothetical protein [Bradyrhizobium sp. Ash2021]WMT72568.1 hypothetical protein NL528_31715 [Bradyrhizobium sp. Ash2021]